MRKSKPVGPMPKGCKPKLTPAQVQFIVDAMEIGKMVAQERQIEYRPRGLRHRLAARFGVSVETVKKISTGERRAGFAPTKNLRLIYLVGKKNGWA